MELLKQVKEAEAEVARQKIELQKFADNDPEVIEAKSIHSS